MDNAYQIPDAIIKAIKEDGYEPDTSMSAIVAKWWSWYTALHDWYDRIEVVDNRRFKVKRHTLHPARRICREWATTILDDDGTRFTAETAQDVLDDWITTTKFIPNAQRCLERAFASGTGAMALWFDVGDEKTTVKARRHDARMVLPLSWDDDGITECAFCTRAQIKGKRYDQLQMHVLEDGSYHIKTRLFERGKEVFLEGIIDDFPTDSSRPPFAIFKPALDNVYVDGTYLGQSIFADAIDAIKGVDNAYDSMQREIDATKVKVFMSDDLFDVVEENGKAVPIPMSPENTVIRKTASNGLNQMYEVFSPQIRIDPLISALNVSLAEIGDLTGFGANYFRFNKDGSVKTAREVSSDNSAFARNIKRHENDLKPQLEGLLGCVLDHLTGLTDSKVVVDFDDSVISDTESEKNMMMAEVGAGVAPPYEYRMQFRGEDEETARRMVSEATGGIDDSFLELTE